MAALPLVGPDRAVLSLVSGPSRRGKVRSAEPGLPASCPPAGLPEAVWGWGRRPSGDRWQETAAWDQAEFVQCLRQI